jgi:hypothetical protein
VMPETAGIERILGLGSWPKEELVY